jgi:hypothetical protein
MRPTETPLAAASVIACLPAFPHCRVARADRLAGLTSAVAATGDIRAGVGYPGGRPTRRRPAPRRGAVVAVQGESVEAIQFLVVPSNADRLAERLSQPVWSLNHIHWAGHSAGRQEDPVDAPEGHLGRREALPLRDRSGPHNKQRKAALAADLDGRRRLCLVQPNRFGYSGPQRYARPGEGLPAGGGPHRAQLRRDRGRKRRPAPGAQRGRDCRPHGLHGAHSW